MPDVTRTRTGLPIEEIADAYRTGLGMPSLATRWGCTTSAIRSVLKRAGVPIRARGGVRRLVPSTEVVRLRDSERLSWFDISRMTGMTEEGLRARYLESTGMLPSQEWHRSSRNRPDLDRAGLTRVNQVIDHRDVIVEAYLHGQMTSHELGAVYGISETTVRRWAAAADLPTSARPAPVDAASALPPGAGRPVGTVSKTAPPSSSTTVRGRRRRRWRSAEEQDSIESWTLVDHRVDPDPYWCLPAEAARILGLSAQRTRQLIFDRAVFSPWIAPGGRVLLRRSDVHTAARLAGPAGPNRWTAVRSALGTDRLTTSPLTAQSTPRPRDESRPVAELPWDAVIADYAAGTPVAELAEHYQVSTRIIRQRFADRGVKIAPGRSRARLRLTDIQLQERRAGGATVAELARLCEVSPTTVWRHLNLVT